MSRSLRILALQPYFGGSHQQFHESWVGNSRHHWTTLSLPARHWKWRMRHASIHFCQKIREQVIQGESWDVIFCTDMLNVAEFKGLISSDPVLQQSLSQTPIVVYFHENQFAYPTRPGYRPDQHFPFTNFISILAADEAWFNSQFNFDSMLEGIHRHAARWPDFKPTEAIETLESKIKIQPPGIETPPINVAEFKRLRRERRSQQAPLRIVWAARWEHDKNPEDLFAALNILKSQKFPFQISVLGQSFQNSPKAFDQIKSEFESQILRWGYQETREQYWEALAECDVFVSTANHEFFGLAAAEAIAAGLHPLFPERLAYPELIRHATDETGSSDDLASYFYDGTPENLATGLQRVTSGIASNESLSDRMIKRLNWQRRSEELDTELTRVVSAF